jgi:hypothetical protein
MIQEERMSHFSLAKTERPINPFFNYLTIEPLVLKELSRELTDLFCLALPAPRA